MAMLVITRWYPTRTFDVEYSSTFSLRVPFEGCWIAMRYRIPGVNFTVHVTKGKLHYIVTCLKMS